MISVKGNLTGKLNTTYTKIYPELENLTVTPSEEQQKFIHEDRYGYDKVVVNPIPDKYIIPSGALDITENGNYNVKEKEFAKVNVPTKTLGTKTITTNGTYLATDDGIDGYSEVNVETSGINIWDYFKEEITYSQISKCIIKIPPITVSNVTSLENMFYGYSSLTSLDLSNFDTSNVTNMGQMFYDCSSLTNIDLSSFDTSKVTRMYALFENCRSLTNLNLSNFNTSQVTSMSKMFSGCMSLTSLDLSSFNTSKVIGMTAMFNASRLTTLDLSNFDTSEVTSMKQMFWACRELTSLNLSNFDTSKVDDMSYMFSECDKLTSLDLSNFNTSKVTDMYQMFYGCKALTNLNISNFDFTKVTSYAYMFNNVPNDCYILVKDAAAKEWITSKFTNLTNVHYVGENYEPSEEETVSLQNILGEEMTDTVYDMTDTEINNTLDNIIGGK